MATTTTISQTSQSLCFSSDSRQSSIVKLSVIPPPTPRTSSLSAEVLHVPVLEARAFLPASPPILAAPTLSILNCPSLTSKGPVSSIPLVPPVSGPPLSLLHPLTPLAVSASCTTEHDSSLLLPPADSEKFKRSSSYGSMGSDGDRAIAINYTGSFPTVKSPVMGKSILVCTESYGGINGVSHTTFNIVTYLRRSGAQVAIIAPSSGQHSLAEDSTGQCSPAKDTAYPPVDAIRMSGWPLPYNPELSAVYPARIDRICQRSFGHLPDLIYIASPATLGLQLLLQLRLLASTPAWSRIPIICNFQTDLSSYADIYFPSPFSHLLKWTLQMTESVSFSHHSVKRVFYPSTAIRNYLTSLAVPSQKLRMLRRGVDTTLFNPCKSSPILRQSLLGPYKTGKELILLSVSRLAPEKGLDFLAIVAQRLYQLRFPFRLHIVGGNSNAAVASSIRSLFADLPDALVVFSGTLKGEELARAYASADVFVHSSVTETFGLVVLEAMASGLPVVARDVGGPSDTVHDGKSGFLVSEADVEGFVERVTRFASVDGERRMGTYAREQAEMQTWDAIGWRVADEMGDALCSSLEDRRHSPVDPTSLFEKLNQNLRLHLSLFVIMLAWIFLLLVSGLLYLYQSTIYRGRRKNSPLTQTSLLPSPNKPHTHHKGASYDV